MIKTESGQGLVEYALILVLVAVVVIVILALLPIPIIIIFFSGINWAIVGIAAVILMVIVCLGAVLVKWVLNSKSENVKKEEEDFSQDYYNRQ